MLGSYRPSHLRRRFSQRDLLLYRDSFFHMCVFFRGAMGLQFLFMDDNAPCHRTVAAEQFLEWILNVWIGRHDLPDLKSHRTCIGFSRQTLGSSYLTTSNDSGASIGASEIISPTKDRMFLARPITGMFRPSVAFLRSMLLFNQASFYPL
ncbi:hypothetical protein TNCV_2384271 [Trichonephila clavipes]|nr:hypothetical protein TNCV_2384271 [Trichonephila clavipes]